MASAAQRTPSQVVQNYFDTFFSRDIDKTLQCLTDDVVWQVQGASDVPTIGARRGKDEVREWFELFPRHFDAVSFDIQRMFEHGDQVVLVGHLLTGSSIPESNSAANSPPYAPFATADWLPTISSKTPSHCGTPSSR